MSALVGSILSDEILKHKGHFSTLPFEQVNSRTVDRSGTERSFESAGRLFIGIGLFTYSPARLFHSSIFCGRKK